MIDHLSCLFVFFLLSNPSPIQMVDLLSSDDDTGGRNDDDDDDADDDDVVWL